MVRDYSAFLPGGTPARREPTALERLGWGPAFASQIDADALTATPPVRVVAVHRSGLQVAGDGIDETIPPGPEATVGDWLLYDRARPRSSRVLERKSLIKRRAPGTGREVQLIAANIDTVFVVTSCNQDFNVARLERYVALAFEAGIEPVIVLTKADLAEDPAPYVEEARKVSDRVPVVALDARGDEPAEALADWCKPGRTVAFLGSSGVGKSTLTNALLGTQAIATQGIREDDARGRHTTTRRELHATPGGCLVLDTPGMRELQLTDAARASPTCSRISRRWPQAAASPTASMRPSPAAPSSPPSKTAASTPRGSPAGASFRPRTPSTPPPWLSAARRTAPSASSSAAQ
jgi:ribosome biogenesis GTPase